LQAVFVVEHLLNFVHRVSDFLSKAYSMTTYRDLETTTWTRRDALRAAALATLPLLQGARRAAAAPIGATVRIAQVGVGNQGSSDLHAIATAPQAKIVALCDVDQNYLDAARRDFADARTFRDYRKLLAEMDGDIDAVVVSTPDHMHVAVALAAMNAGKHVYVQKPLAHNLAELRRLRDVAADKGVVTQMGTQIHAHEAYRTAVKMLRDGVLGKVREAQAWVHSSWSTPFDSEDRPADPVPATLDWDLWQGVAPPRAFVAGRFHPAAWRRWRDYGGGTLGDMGCHIFDSVFSGLGLQPPTTVESFGPPHGAQTFAGDGDVRYTFAGTPLTTDKFTLRWTHGSIRADAAAAQLPPDVKLPGSGSFVVGERGVMVLPHWAMPTFYHQGAPMDLDVESAGSVDHYHEWVAACSGAGTTSTPFSYSAIVTEAVLLGTLAGSFPKQLLTWNSDELEFDNKQANALIHRTYRDGWRPLGM
jgi:predicted dehydrogenase